MDEFKLHNGSGSLDKSGCGRQDNKLNTYDWLADVPGNSDECDIVEVQFKNTRKGYYLNSNKLPLEKGDVVAVEASPGHDIGTVTLTGRLVRLQLRKTKMNPDTELKRVYRKARQVDMEKFAEAKSREHDTMIRSRQIAKDLNLEMKIGDVEYQGDGNKAIFYYIADGRVDFRQLIKVLAEAFRVRIEMKQIGARQEAGRIGGFGPCGRELCCATFTTNFVSVSTGAARFQDISLNPQRLAGLCAKLKCCLNFEVDTYAEIKKHFPSKEIQLESADGTYYYFKADILKREITYSTDKYIAANLVTLSPEQVFEVIALNRKGIKPESLTGESAQADGKPSTDLLDQENICRFDKSKKKKKKKKKAAPEGEAAPAPAKARHENEAAAAEGEAPAQREPKGERNDRNRQPQQKERPRKPKGDNREGRENRPPRRNDRNDRPRQPKGEGDSPAQPKDEGGTPQE